MMMKPLVLIGAAMALSGCVAEAPLAVAPGQGKSYSDLQRDDAACRVAPPAAQTAATTTPVAPNYYQCMSSRGELIVPSRPAAYPVYAAAYPYPYPAYGYPYYGYGYGYPYPAAYVGPYVGIGIGLGFGHGYYGGRGYDGGRGYGGRSYGGGGSRGGDRR